MNRISFICAAFILLLYSCKKENDPLVSSPFNYAGSFIDNKPGAQSPGGVDTIPLIKVNFSSSVNRSSLPGKLTLSPYGLPAVPVSYSYERNDSTVIINPASPLKSLTRYVIFLSPELTSATNIKLNTPITILFGTEIDSTDKFPVIPDADLLTLVQRQTFKYFWDFGHPVSGMARERNTSGDLVTTGGTGFGIAAIPVAVSRNFITRTEGLNRVMQIVDFYINNCTAYHGAYAHWIHGASGATMPFSPQDNGADIVETSYLMEGLIIAREFFNSTTNATEISLRSKINQLWDGVDWNWFRQNMQDQIYWHWSPTGGFAINAQVRGWNEALITYVMAASSRTNAIPASVYSNGWAGNGSMVNNNTYYGYTLPLGPSNGGPLFFEHYSFIGIDPNGLSDAYADYDMQTTNHTLINYEYCKANPRNWYGYSAQCWGLTASDIPDGYNANEPNNDPGVISPTAALSSMPYTPAESMAALKFFYYKLGDKLWGNYGFYDAFKLSDPWFASSTLAIDQGPIIIMIENYRTGLPWQLFTGAPEIVTGMTNLGFTAPYL